MKTTKKLIAVLLAIATLFTLFVTSASALEKGDTVEWTFIGQPDNDYTAEIPFKGTLTEGSHDLEDTNEEYNTCYEFEAEKGGYYMLTFPAHELEALFADTYSDGKARNYADHIFTSFTDSYGLYCYRRIAYLEKGTTLINIQFDEMNPTGTEITIEYVAEEITDIIYDEKELEFLLIDYDEVYIYADEKIVEIPIEYSIEFSNPDAPDIGIQDWLQCSYEGEITAGKNALTVTSLPGFEKEITAGIYCVSDIVESVELDNAENYLNATKHYDETYSHDTYTGEKVTVNFNNGTSETITFIYGEENYVTFPCGKEYPIRIGYTVDERAVIGTGNYILYATFGGSGYYGIAECSVTEASSSENLEVYKSKISGFAGKIKGHWEMYMENMAEDGDFFYWIERGFNDTGFYLSLILTETSYFIDYCF